MGIDAARPRGMTGFGVEIPFRDWGGLPHRDKWARELEPGTMLRAELTPGAFYRRAHEHFERLDHRNPEEGHYLERFWVAVFEPDWRRRVASSPA